MRASQPHGSCSTGPSGVPVVHVHTGDGRVFRFSQGFRIGRDHDCDVRVNDVHVSRTHAAGSFEKGVWHLHDLKSANGVFVDGRRIETVVIRSGLTISLGIDGPSLSFEVEAAGKETVQVGTPAPTIRQAKDERDLLASYEQRYFGHSSGGERVGGRTMMIRRAFEHVQRRQRRRYWWLVGVAAAAALTAAGYAYYKHRQIVQQQALAQDLFYAMKALDVDIANVERLIAESGSAQAKAQVKTYMTRRRDMENTYDRFLAVLDLYDASLSEEDRLILRVTRTFGECELAAPSDYIAHIKSYIRKWQSSPRYARAMKQSEQMGYTKRIAAEFLGQNLPPQFLYLALQESDFNPFNSGPPTYMGIAKGMWQFIPETASRYGLTIGPLAKQRIQDPLDDRHNWEKATQAAARYIKDIYSTDAQASGLLVMASYNWGENRVVNLIRSMPANPQERNFWKLVEKYRTRIPQQTYDYVFYIVSAAVIGENPRLFGFDFDNPLGFLDSRNSHAAVRDQDYPARPDINRTALND